MEGNSGDSGRVQAIAAKSGSEVVVGEWPDETSHRRFAYQYLLDLGYSHALTLDTDEVVEPRLLNALLSLASADVADRVYVSMDTYWKSVEYVVRPREQLTPCALINLREVAHSAVRDFSGGRALVLDEDFGVLHHLSYAGPDERIWKKITTWGHRDEVLPGWWENSWKHWDNDRLLRNLHPTHPSAFGFAMRRQPPEFLKPLVDPSKRLPDVEYVGPNASVVIPVLNGQEDLDDCLASLRQARGIVTEIVVVDNGSEPPIAVPKGVGLIRNDSNRGFATACNQGFLASTQEAVIFLNNDTLVQRAAIARLLQSLHADPTVAAAGPLSNNAGHWQMLECTYDSPAHYEQFAHDFAFRPSPDIDVDILVGFCLAVRRSVMKEVGLFDERFEIGMFEDNDLCHRFLRSGYRLVLSTRSVIHHHGSRTFEKLQSGQPSFSVNDLFYENSKKYYEKWKLDLETGFASALAGMSGAPIRFDFSKKPEVLFSGLHGLKERADITLCMIVRDEERVIRECLESAMPFFMDIHILDTGSSDRTIEIAQECGAKVWEMAWPESFAEARTESMRQAKSKWVMWMDADDTLPFSCGVEILEAASKAHPDVLGFVVPVRFVESGGLGTAVDHVKVFRNFPGIEWEGRIHEQVLSSLRSCGEKQGIREGKLVRLNAYVLHSGYDTSSEGQAKKRERDNKLLKLDLLDRPGHPFVLFNLGMTAYYLGDYPEAINYLQQSIDQSDRNESHLRKAYALLGAAHKHKGDAKKAKDLLLKGLETCSGDPEILFYLGQIAAEQGDHEDAIRLYEQVLRADVSTVFTSLDPGILGFKTRHNLALSHIEVGDYPSARGLWLQSLADSGGSEIALLLHKFALLNGDLMTANQTLAWIQAHDPRGEHWAIAVGGAATAVGLDPAEIYESKLRADPQNTVVRKALAIYLLNSKRQAAAISHLKQLDTYGVPEGAYFLGILSEEQGDLGHARYWLERALNLNPDHVDTRLRLELLADGRLND